METSKDRRNTDDVGKKLASTSAARRRGQRSGTCVCVCVFKISQSGKKPGRGEQQILKSGATARISGQIHGLHCVCKVV